MWKTLMEHIQCCSVLSQQLDYALPTATALLVIQGLADTICASVPFHLGDRNSVVRIDDKNIQFPASHGHPLPEGHQAVAAAFGGFLLMGPLAELLPPKVPLRAGQKQWIGGQMGRIKRIYNIHAS